MNHPIERRNLTQELCRRLMLPSFEMVPVGEEDAIRRVHRQMVSMDAWPGTTLARQLISDGLELPDPDSISSDQINAKLLMTSIWGTRPATSICAPTAARNPPSSICSIMPRNRSGGIGRTCSRRM